MSSLDSMQSMGFIMWCPLITVQRASACVHGFHSGTARKAGLQRCDIDQLVLSLMGILQSMQSKT